MVVQPADPGVTFNKRFANVQGYQVTTPYGIITVSGNGRRISFELYEDVRQSIHHKALLSYYQQLIRKGVSRINCDHLQLPGLDGTIDLRRGKARLDCAYYNRGKLVEVELKTHREIGLDVTRKQLEELATYCENLILVVPREDMENALTVLTMIGLNKQITVDTYEIYEEEGEEET
jgi:hypothetical protein